MAITAHTMRPIHFLGHTISFKTRKTDTGRGKYFLLWYTGAKKYLHPYYINTIKRGYFEWE